MDAAQSGRLARKSANDAVVGDGVVEQMRLRLGLEVLLQMPYRKIR